MTKDLSYFMRKEEERIVKVQGPETITGKDGKPVALEVRILSNQRIQELNEKYTERRFATDKKGNPLVTNGEVVHEVIRDRIKATRHMIAEALVYPNLNDEELKKYYNCYDITEMLFKVFPAADEYAHVSRVVLAVLGLGPDLTDDDKLVEEAKN